MTTQRDAHAQDRQYSRPSHGLAGSLHESHAAAFAAAPDDGSGDKYLPHVTVGVAPMDYLEALKAKPFEPFTFAASSMAIYHLGNFGTAQEKLWSARP